jgi:hypothetical protein
MKYILNIIILFSILLIGCRREKFDTLINIKLVSGISKLKVNPCKVLVIFHRSKDGLPYTSAVLDTLITDSFGNCSKIVKLAKPQKNEYYNLVLLETKWQLPIGEEHRIKPEIENNVGLGIKPKWRRSITLEDSSGKYELDFYQCHNSLTKTFYEIQKYDSFPKLGQQFLFSSAPSYSHIFIKLTLHSRKTKEARIIEKIYDSEKYNNIWIKF